MKQVYTTMKIPSIDFGGNGKLLHFSHANAYHPRAYQQLINPLLGHFQVKSILFRPLWQAFEPQEVPSWETHANDIIRFLDENNHKDVVGVGHSLGAITTLIAASKRPDLFSSIILIEPVVFSPEWGYYLWSVIPFSIRYKTVPPAKIALNRKDQWPSIQAAYDHLRPKSIFKRIPDQVFWDIISNCIIESPEGKAQLGYSKQWEAHTYSTVTNPWKPMRKIDLPFLVLRGEHTNVISAKTWRKLQRFRKDGTYINFQNTGHLLPFEEPQGIASEILNFSL